MTLWQRCASRSGAQTKAVLLVACVFGSASVLHTLEGPVEIGCNYGSGLVLGMADTKHTGIQQQIGETSGVPED